MSAKKILFFIQLAPPLHGAALMNQRVLDVIAESDSFSAEVLRLNYAYDFQSMHDATHKKIIYTLKIYLAFMYSLIFQRPNSVYIAFAPFGLGFYRDFMLAMISRAFGCEVKLHLHGTGLSSTKTKIKSWLLSKLFQSCDLVLLSEALYPDVSRFVLADRVTYISNAVDTPTVNKRKLNEVVTFLYVANLDERKGVLKAVEVFSEYFKSNEDSILNVVGADTVAMTKKKLLEIIEDKYPHLNGKVRLLGALYGKEKEEVYSSADIFIYPTEHDAAPLVVLEALSYGLPVVCSNQGALSDMVIDGGNGFVVDEFNVASYVDSINGIRASYAKFSNSAKDIHLERDSITALSKKIKDLFCD
ncbi:MAG: glycosyltransferase family 4 protein [Colwellia sp.]|jgi:Glycosyltransferase